MIDNPEVVLRKIATVIMGTSPKGTTYNYDGIGMPLLNGPTEFGQVHPHCTLYTTDSKRKCQEGDLIFCVRGSTGRMNWANQVYSLGRGVCAIRGKTLLDTKFIRYCLESKLDGLLSLAGGSTFSNLTTDTIKNFPIPYPESRYKIAAILSTYDDLIENNTRRIKILEDMAQTLYREWFVHFRFPGHENVPMVESSLGPIPQGWEIMQIKEIVDDYIGGGWGKKKKDTKHIVPAYVIRGTDFVHVRHVKTDTCPLRFHTQSNFRPRQLEVDDIVMEISGGGKDWGVGRSILVTPQILRAFEDPVICASFCKRLTLNSEIYSPLIFMMYLQEAYTNKDLERYELRSTGIRNFQFATFLEKEWIPVPHPSIQKQFVVKAQSLIDSIQNMGARNANLRQTRDLLLPKLISGEIDVSELDIDINTI